MKSLSFMVIKMFSGTWHIEKQHEWFEKLKNPPYNCVRVEMEYVIENNARIDVWGKDRKGKEYLIEIGCCAEYQKRKEYCEKHGFIFKNIPKPCTIQGHWEIPENDKKLSKCRNWSTISWLNHWDIISKRLCGFENKRFPKETTSAQFFGLVSRGDINAK